MEMCAFFVCASFWRQFKYNNDLRLYIYIYNRKSLLYFFENYTENSELYLWPNVKI